MNRIHSISSIVLLVAALTSCTVPAKETEERDANGKKIEYVYYTPVGSNIPIRVRKDQLKGTDKDNADAQKFLTDAERLGVQPPPQALAGAH
jgi:hypothetical protein